MFLSFTLILGCGGAKLYDRPSPISGGYYEVAWIDPEIILTDTLYTLIRSDRIVSLYNDKPDPYKSLAPTISFRISSENCPTSINIFDSRSRLLIPLIVKNLRAGFYKMTFNADRLTDDLARSPSYLLKADFCGQSVAQPFVR